MDTFIDVSFYLRFAIKIKNVPLPMPYIIPEDITSIISSIVTAHSKWTISRELLDFLQCLEDKI